MWPAQGIVWTLYALFNGLFAWAWKAAPRWRETCPTPANAHPPGRILLRAGVGLGLLAPVVHKVLAPWRSTIVTALWLGLVVLLTIDSWISALLALRGPQEA